MATAAIEFSNVSKSYGRGPALEDFSLSIPQGGIWGFLGPNGAGKTTAMRLLIDIIRPSSGTVSVLGNDCQRDGVNARRHLGYLPGDLHLYDGYTGAALLDLFATLRGTKPDAYAHELCDRLNLDVDKRIAALSKGNRQKVGIVLALMHRPEVVVLDEPTSGLDPLVQDEVESILREMAATGRTIFFSSHVLSEVERLCNHVAILRKGRLVASEDVSDLKGRSLHIIEASFAATVPDSVFAAEGIQVLRHDGNSVHLQVRSDLDAAIKTIAKYPVVDLRTEQPSLEDVFLAFYQESTAVRATREEPAA